MSEYNNQDFNSKLFFFTDNEDKKANFSETSASNENGEQVC